MWGEWHRAPYGRFYLPPTAEVEIVLLAPVTCRYLGTHRLTVGEPAVLPSGVTYTGGAIFWGVPNGDTTCVIARYRLFKPEWSLVG